jgi:hypothetical protein
MGGAMVVMEFWTVWCGLTPVFKHHNYQNLSHTSRGDLRPKT